MAREIERRMVTSALIEVRAKDGASPSIEGYGALYGVETVIGDYFREVIAPGAFSDTVQEDDIRVLFNHSPNYVLGRNAARTADVSEDKTGLLYVARLNPDDPEAMSVGAKIKRRDVTGSSFSFTVENDDDETWTRDDPAKLPLRTIKRARVYDVGPVTFPAYEETTVSARSKNIAGELGGADKAAAAKAAAVQQQPADAAAQRTATTPVVDDDAGKQRREEAREAVNKAKAWRP